MKRLTFSVMLFLALGPSAATFAQGITGVQVTNETFKKRGSEVSVAMQIDLTQMQVARQRSVVLQPVIVALDGSAEKALPAVAVDGKVRSRVHSRQQLLAGTRPDAAAFTEVRRRNGTPQTVDYRQTVTYEPWMADSRVELRETVTGCAECGKGEGTVPVADRFITLFTPTYTYSWLAPDPEPVKTRAQSAEARIQFRQDKYDILPDYKGNRRELDEVRRSVNVIYDDSDVTITTISITGYASPEGSVPHNLTLSRNRARALLSYIVRQYEVPQHGCKAEGRGEDWEGLRTEVERMEGLTARDEVLRVIDNVTDDRDRAELQLKAIRPRSEVYDRLYTDVYPRLRRNEYRIEYNVRNFNVEEARQLIRTNPTKLSLEEMYKVAGSYEKGSAAYNEALAIAAATYPNQPAALNNAALAQLDAGDAQAAIRTLAGRAAGQATLLNTLGVAYARTDQTDRARQCFADAKALGSKEAAANLEQVERYIAEQ